MEIELRRVNDKVGFEGTNAEGLKVCLDGSPAAGGEGKGVRPTEALLMAVASCSAIDVVLILAKQRQLLDDIRIKARAERDTDAHPQVFKSIHLHFDITGTVLPQAAERAIALSIEKYCTVGHMIRRDIPITTSFAIHEG